MLRERLRVGLDFSLRQSSVHFAGAVHGRYGARDEYARNCASY